MQNEPKEKYKLELKELPALEQKNYTKITCPACEQDLPADNLNINDKIAKCGSCHVVFPFHEEVARLNKNKQRLRQEVIRPEGVDISYFRNEMDLAIQQNAYWGWILFFFVFCALMVTLVYWKGKAPILLPALTWLSTLYPFTNLITQSRHKIHINVDDHYLNVKWRPKHFMKDKSYAIEEIEQLYIKNTPEMGGYYKDVWMIVNGAKGQKHVKLIQMVASLSKAKYLEQEIERHIGIVDKKVAGEISS